MSRERYLTARQAAEELEISLATLYAYVSRGLIRSEATGGDTRTRRYWAEDVQKLKERKEQQRNPGKVAEGALHWGAPVMESALTLIANGRLFYRGHDAVQLATTHTVEQVAALLWTGELPADASGLFATTGEALSAQGAAMLQLLAHVPTVEAFQVLLPLAAADDLAAYDLRPTAVIQTGGRILRLLTAIASAERSMSEGIVQALQRRWRPNDPHALALLDAALILSADHELNVSAFTARCVASAGSTPYAVVIAGLSALQGVKHGGHSARVEALLREAGTPAGVRLALAQRLKRGEQIPGFGHQLYPNGDPRGAALLQLISAAYPDSPAVALSQAMVEQMQRLIGEHPTIDFGLATLSAALELPPGSPLTLFALGRTIGWIGHAIEQYQLDRIIRPRARYIGEQPIE
ncbi:MAG TPA: citrate synthase family protein [Herpetosiphonaceae bacterium]